MDPIAPPEHADNVPLGDLLNALPVPGGHGINTVAAARNAPRQTTWRDECVYTHKVIERHIVGGNVLPPLDNAPLSAAEFHAALQPGGVITNAINHANAASLEAAFAPTGVGTNAIAAAFAPDGVGTNAIAAAVAAGARATKLFLRNQARRKANAMHDAAVNLPYVEAPGPNQGTTPTMEELGFGIGRAPLKRVQTAVLLVAQIDVIYDIYREDSFRPGLCEANRRRALELFIFG
jgi:hypothetical protein